MLTFDVLAACFEQLEQTSSRLQLTALLAALLGQVGADEIAEVSYLLQGRVAPLYEPVEFGLGEKSLEVALARAKLGDGKEHRTALEEAYNRTSDLGLLGLSLWSGGLEAVRALDIAVGRPLRPQLAERLPD